MSEFVNIPVCLIGNEGDGDKTVIAKIRLSEIAIYYPCFYWGTTIILNSGRDFLTTTEFDEVDKLINEHSNNILCSKQQIKKNSKN